MESTFPELNKLVGIATPQAANGFSQSDYISCKNAHKVWFVIHHYSGGGDTDLVLGLKEATNVAAGTSAADETANPTRQEDERQRFASELPENRASNFF